MAESRINEQRSQSYVERPFERIDELRPYGRERTFAAGSQLRELGCHYNDMLLLVDGRLRIEFSRSTGKKDVYRSAGPVGEIGFLYGLPATTTVIAQGSTQTLHFDDEALSRLEVEDPGLAAAFLRYLARSADDRTGVSMAQHGHELSFDPGQEITTLLCRDEATLVQAQRLRYDVYCIELGRDSPHADHDQKIIRDPLDTEGYTFLAKKDNEIVGTIRGNFCNRDDLGVLNDLYGMRHSPHFPDRCGVCTKFIISRANRGGRVAMSLIARVADFGLRNGVEECYIDCIPGLLHYYKAMGFQVAGEEFLHRENGPSIPMKIDLNAHKRTLCAGDSTLNMLRLYWKAKIIKALGRRGGSSFARRLAER